MNKDLSIVLVDKRPYRKIAQDNWGLTDEQMKGMHVHHRIPISKGGTNDPSNLYVCSPSFHRWGWHTGQEWIEWANKGNQRAKEVSRMKRETDQDWALKEKVRLSTAAKLSHSKNKGTKKYSEMQRAKSLHSHVTKRRNWTSDLYDVVWGCFLEGVDSGYKIGRKLKDNKWKKYHNMLKYLSLGFSFEQVTDKEKYIEELTRLEESPISHLLNQYDD